MWWSLGSINHNNSHKNCRLGLIVIIKSATSLIPPAQVRFERNSIFNTLKCQNQWSRRTRKYITTLKKVRENFSHLPQGTSHLLLWCIKIWWMYEHQKHLSRKTSLDAVPLKIIYLRNHSLSRSDKNAACFSEWNPTGDPAVIHWPVIYISQRLFLLNIKTCYIFQYHNDINYSYHL
jgi:hypothetical protein